MITRRAFEAKLRNANALCNQYGIYFDEFGDGEVYLRVNACTTSDRQTAKDLAKALSVAADRLMLLRANAEQMRGECA